MGTWSQEIQGSDQKSICLLCSPRNSSCGLGCHFKCSKCLCIQLVPLQMASSPVLHFVVLYCRAVPRTVAFLIVNSVTELTYCLNTSKRLKEIFPIGPWLCNVLVHLLFSLGLACKCRAICYPDTSGRADQSLV